MSSNVSTRGGLADLPQEAAHPPGRLLVIEDDAVVRGLIEATLRIAGHAVHTTATVADAWALVRQAPFDLLLLDIGLPDGNGLEVCARIRGISAVPIILLTGLRDESAVVAGLQAGADDYVTKPFSPRELLARVEANLRRWPIDTSPAACHQVVLDDGRFVVNFGARTVRVGDHESSLTPREFAILGYLALHAGRVVPHDELIEQVWGERDPSRMADLRTYVKLIRRKIEPRAATPRYLHARPGAGYILAVAPSSAAG